MTVEAHRSASNAPIGNDHERGPEWERLLQQEGLILEVTETLYELMASDAVSKAEIARRIGKTRGFVSQILNGGRNMTLRTLADFAWALDCRIEIDARPLNSRLGEADIRPSAAEGDIVEFLSHALDESAASRDDLIRAVERVLAEKAHASGVSYPLVLRQYMAERRATQAREGRKHRRLQAVHDLRPNLTGAGPEVRGVA